jgi:hypothetical protein
MPAGEGSGDHASAQQALRPRVDTAGHRSIRLSDQRRATLLSVLLIAPLLDGLDSPSTHHVLLA